MSDNKNWLGPSVGSPLRKETQSMALPIDDMKTELSKRVFVLWYKNLISFMESRGFKNFKLQAVWYDDSQDEEIVINLNTLEATEED